MTPTDAVRSALAGGWIDTRAVLALAGPHVSDAQAAAANARLERAGRPPLAGAAALDRGRRKVVADALNSLAYHGHAERRGDKYRAIKTGGEPVSGRNGKATKAEATKAGREGKPGRGSRAKATRLPLADLEADATVQPRVNGLDAGHVEDMAADLAADPGFDLPPIVVYRDPAAGVYRISEGFHRAAAYADAGRDDIPCEVRDGDLTACKLNARASNVHKGHGLKRSNADKARAVRDVLALATEWADNRIAKFLAVDDTTVADARRELVAAAAIPDLDYRVGEDGRRRTIRRQSTSGIPKLKNGRESDEQPTHTDETTLPPDLAAAVAALPAAERRAVMSAPDPVAAAREAVRQHELRSRPDAGEADPDAWRSLPADSLDLPAGVARPLRLLGLRTVGEVSDRVDGPGRAGLSGEDAGLVRRAVRAAREAAPPSPATQATTPPTRARPGDAPLPDVPPAPAPARQLPEVPAAVRPAIARRAEQDAAAKLCRQLDLAMAALVNGAGAEYLRKVQVAPGVPLVREVRRKANRVVSTGFEVPALVALTRAVSDARVQCACPFCSGAGCGKCEHLGHLPDGFDYLVPLTAMADRIVTEAMGES